MVSASKIWHVVWPEATVEKFNSAELLHDLVGPGTFGRVVGDHRTDQRVERGLVGDHRSGLEAGEPADDPPAQQQTQGEDITRGARPAPASRLRRPEVRVRLRRRRGVHVEARPVDLEGRGGLSGDRAGAQSPVHKAKTMRSASPAASGQAAATAPSQDNGAVSRRGAPTPSSTT